MIESLAASAVALSAPYLGMMGAEAAKVVGKGGATATLKLLDWLRIKVTAGAREALGEMEAKPSDNNKAVLRVELVKLLEACPDLVSELRALVTQAETESVSQQMNLGDDSRAVQSAGDKNTITISG